MPPRFIVDPVAIDPQDCLNHDACVEEACLETEGIDRLRCNTFGSECADEFCLAIDDFFFAPDCERVQTAH